MMMTYLPNGYKKWMLYSIACHLERSQCHGLSALKLWMNLGKRDSQALKKQSWENTERDCSTYLLNVNT